jgi:hypothetical protein
MNRSSFKASIPFVLGIIGIIAYIGYFIVKDSNNNLAFGICILLPPISFFSGIIAAILTRKYKEKNNTLWWSGFAICLVGTILYALLILLLICAALAIREL